MFQSGSRIVAACLLLIAAFLTGGGIAWYWGRTPNRTVREQEIPEPNPGLIPQPEPSDGWSSLPKSVTARPLQGAFGDVAVPILLIKNVDDALALEARTAAFETRVSLSRSADGLDCLIYSERGRRAIAVKGCRNIGGGPVPAQPTMGHKPSFTGSLDAAREGIGPFQIMPSPKGTILLMSTKSGDQTIPLVGDFLGEVAKMAPGYRYAVMVKRKQDLATKVGILIVDTTPLALAGEVAFPSDIRAIFPTFVLDSQTDGLVVIEGDLKWAMVIDLHPLAEEASQSAK